MDRAVGNPAFKSKCLAFLRGRRARERLRSKKQQRWRKSYVDQCNRLISFNEIQDWYSCTLYASVHRNSSIESYFSKEFDRSGSFFSRKFSAKRFLFINSLITIDIEKAQQSLSGVLKYYVPSNFNAPDETMIPCMMRFAPHHIYIIRKPHRNGVLFTSSADSNGIVTGFSLRKRTDVIMVNLCGYKRTRSDWRRSDVEKAAPMKVETMIDEVTEGLPGGSVIVTDRLYSGIPLLKRSLVGHYYSSNCQKNLISQKKYLDFQSKHRHEM